MNESYDFHICVYGAMRLVYTNFSIALKWIDVNEDRVNEGIIVQKFFTIFLLHMTLYEYMKIYR